MARADRQATEKKMDEHGKAWNMTLDAGCALTCVRALA
jgi:hypothetical protein